MALSRLHLMALLAALITAVGCSRAEADAPASAPAPEVSVAEVIAQPLHDSAEFTGRLAERERVEVRSRVAGYIDSVHFRDGARVRRGQLLFKIDPRPAQAALAQMQAALAKDEAARDLALAQVNRYEPVAQKGFISADQMQQYRTAYSAAAASVSSVGMSPQHPSTTSGSPSSSFDAHSQMPSPRVQWTIASSIAR